jgi:hypothetical protein
MEEPRTEDELRSVRYLHNSGSRCSSDRDDGLGDRWPSTVDLTTNGSAPNPLAGPSTRQAEATEARALSMITGSAVSSAKNTHQCVGDLGQNVQKKLSSWMSSVSGTAKRRRGESISDLESRASVNDQSDGSLVVVNVKKRVDAYPASPVRYSSLYRQCDQLSTLVKQTETFQVKDTSDGVTQSQNLPQTYSGAYIDQLAAAMEAMSPKVYTSILPSQQTNPADGARIKQYHQISSNAQQLNTMSAENLIPEDEISLFDLPSPLHELYKRAEYKNWSLNSGLLALDSTVEEANKLGLVERMTLATTTPDLPSVDAFQTSPNDWKYIDKDGSVLGGASPSASMIIEETDTLVEEPELLGLIRNSPSHSRRGSAASSGSELNLSECVLPTIYPGMAQYPPPSNCASEVHEDWSNTSRSLFDSDPEYHHRVVSIPLHLRGGGDRKKTRRHRSWSLFLEPLAGCRKGQDIAGCASSLNRYFLLGRRGKRKTDRELCEETGRRIEQA